MFADTLDRPEAGPVNGALDGYLARQLFHPQWRAFARAIAAELFGSFPRDEAGGFLRQIGRRMAAELPLPRLETLPELERAINATLEATSWGVASFSLAGGEILIRHEAFPALPPEDPDQDHWRSALEALLEGLYGAWFESQVAAADMRARVDDPHRTGAIVIRIGY